MECAGLDENGRNEELGCDQMGNTVCIVGDSRHTHRQAKMPPGAQLQEYDSRYTQLNRHMTLGNDSTTPGPHRQRPECLQAHGFRDTAPGTPSSIGTRLQVHTFHKAHDSGQRLCNSWLTQAEARMACDRFGWHLSNSHACLVRGSNYTASASEELCNTKAGLLCFCSLLYPALTALRGMLVQFLCSLAHHASTDPEIRALTRQMQETQQLQRDTACQPTSQGIRDPPHAEESLTPPPRQKGHPGHKAEGWQGIPLQGEAGGELSQQQRCS
eukprot:1160437-Pelagomonas_calceolata.AAC.3